MIRSFLTLCVAQMFVGAAFAATLADIGAGDLVISEIMPYPTGVAASKGQWFEVYNASGVPVNLNGVALFLLAMSSLVMLYLYRIPRQLG